MATLKLSPTLYSVPPKNAVPGARTIYASYAVLAADQIATQLIGLAVLPAGHRLMAASLESADMDTGAALTISVGILNTYYNQAAATVAVPAAYNSGGVTDTGTTPALVSGQNLFTSETIGQAGGRVNMPGAVTTTLTPSTSIGVDYANDRIIAVQFPVPPAGTQAGTLALIYTIDQD